MLLQGSTSRLLLVLRFYCVELELVMVSLVSAHSNLLLPITQCGFGWYFWLGGMVILVGLSRLWALFWWLHFLARGWNLHFIDSHVVGAIVGVS